MENNMENAMANIIPIIDFNAPELDIYARYKEVQLLHLFEPNGGAFIAESPKVIARALNLGCEPISFLMEETHVHTQCKELIARCPDTPVYTAPFDVLTKLTGFQLTRGALCAMRRPTLPTVAEVCKNAKRIAVLEDVVNPTNVGAIFRSAAAMHMDAVLLTPNCADPYYRRAARVSMGTVFQIPWTYFPKNKESTTPFAQEIYTENKSINTEKSNNLKTETADLSGCSYIATLHELGFTTAAMALKEDSISIADPILKSTEKLAIVLGTEGEGLADSTIASCDYTVLIPMSHGVDSLNVAAASAVAFWEINKG